jgi:hypothetical protein
VAVIIYNRHLFRILMIKSLRCFCLQQKILVKKFFHGFYVDTKNLKFSVSSLRF